MFLRFRGRRNRNVVITRKKPRRLIARLRAHARVAARFDAHLIIAPPVTARNAGARPLLLR